MSGRNTNTAQPGFARRGPGPMMGTSEKPTDSRGTFRRLMKYFSGERTAVIVMFIVVTAGVVLQVIAPSYLSSAIDTITSQNFERLGRILVIMIAIYVINSIVTLTQEYTSARLSQRIIRRIRSELFARTIDLPVSYIDGHSRGDLISRMTNDAENISNVISSSLGSLFSGVLLLIGTLFMMLRYDVKLTILSLAVLMLSVIFTQVISRIVRRLFLKRQTLLGRINGLVEENVNYYRTVTTYNLQDVRVSEFDATSDELTRTGIAAEAVSSALGPVMSMINNIQFVVVAVFGAYYVLSGDITVGVISAFIVYSKQLSRPINELSQLYGQVQTALAGAERVFEILDAAPEDKSGDIRMDTCDGVIEFKHVNFSYVPGKEVIHDFNLRVDRGKKIALVGSTGSGKTTIVNLLMRFYDIDSGEITLDGINIRDINCSDLRDLVGIVLQDTTLFTDTIRANMTYAVDGKVRKKDLDEAAAMSGVDKIVAALPDGYKTMLVDSGGNLSQGQQQLIAIGRAFLSYPHILILDEATSNIDTRTEMDIQDSMVRLMEGRTSLIIAHRLSTIRDADTIVVMDKGSIVETGTHDELIARGGVYSDLYATQFAGQAT